MVEDLLTGMNNTARAVYMSNSYLEIAIDERDLHLTASDLTALDELSRLAPLLPRIQKLTIGAAIPTTGWKIMTKAEYKVSPARAFLMRVVEELRSFKGLKRMEVVLALPEGFCSNRHLLILYILPFYALDAFTFWKLKFQVHESRIPQLADVAFIKLVDEKHAEIRGGERKATKDGQDRKDAAQKEINKARFTRLSNAPVPGKSEPGSALCRYPHCKYKLCKSALCKNTIRK
ncbi:hypothetical protein BDZ45DRAFT_678455 [Acephala macrosclerotiorum]|nr:hypothetical protein BDZ45DRAFT_678455 [Acephala macrosclerotiorum]